MFIDWFGNNYSGVISMQRKTAIITGGGSGFGRETALKLAQRDKYFNSRFVQ
jgi:hypothetical protein